MAKSDGRAGRPWRRIRAQVLVEEPFCYRCGRWATTVDHIVPLSVAPHLAHVRSNLRGACLSCNSSGGARITNAKRRAQAQQLPRMRPKPKPRQPPPQHSTRLWW